ncbi:MAG: hypothetical protein V1701_05600 [Planctomycetota bacterium]
MQDLNKLMLWAALFIACPLVASAELDYNGDPDQQAQSEMSQAFFIRTGTEIFNYQELEAGTQTSSEAESITRITSFHFIQGYQGVLFGIKGVTPYQTMPAVEKWDRANISPFQTNDLKYSWFRLDAYIGQIYGAGEGVQPGTWYTGLRYSMVKQRRSNFYDRNGLPTDSSQLTENIKSYQFLLGYQAVAPIMFKAGDRGQSSILDWDLELEGSFPLYNRVTNTAYPGLTFKDKGGYGVEVKTGLNYHLGETITVGADLFGGRIYWKGSDWKVISATEQYRWPENKTDYLGLQAGIAISF